MQVGARLPIALYEKKRATLALNGTLRSVVQFQFEYVLNERTD